MKNLRKLSSAITVLGLTTVSAVNVVACGNKETINETYSTPVEYYAVYTNEKDIELYQILWNKYDLLIDNEHYEKFKDKLKFFIDKSDEKDEISDGTLNKISFTYKDTNTVVMGMKFLLLKDLFDIEGTKKIKIQNYIPILTNLGQMPKTSSDILNAYKTAIINKLKVVTQLSNITVEDLFFYRVGTKIEITSQDIINGSTNLSIKLQAKLTSKNFIGFKDNINTTYTIQS